MRTFAAIMDTILSCGIVEDIGQIGKDDLRLLNKAVKAGVISKGKGGEYPVIKTVFAPKGFNFIRHRQAVIDLYNAVSKGEITPGYYMAHKFNYSIYIFQND